jgi:hypothetical protein
MTTNKRQRERIGAALHRWNKKCFSPMAKNIFDKGLEYNQPFDAH